MDITTITQNAALLIGVATAATEGLKRWLKTTGWKTVAVSVVVSFVVALYAPLALGASALVYIGTALALAGTINGIFKSMKSATAAGITAAKNGTR